MVHKELRIRDEKVLSLKLKEHDESGRERMEEPKNSTVVKFLLLGKTQPF